MLGRPSPAFASIARSADYPILGPLLYRLNVNPFVIGKMVSGHVYSEPGWLTGARRAEKLAVTRAAGARHASFRFVAGELDPMPDRDTFLAAAGRVNAPILVVYGAETPRRSKAEMEALAALPNVRTVVVPRGKLSVNEEFPEPVATAVREFLAQQDKAPARPRDP
jgi:pimeloyl-ACP methyl ester carboxylesterase